MSCLDQAALFVDMMDVDSARSATMRRRQRRLRQFLRHERLSVAVAPAESTHHNALRRPEQARAGEEDHEINYTATVRTHPLPQAASTLYFTLDDDEEMFAAGVRPAGPPERVLRHIVGQIVEFCACGADSQPSCAADGAVVASMFSQRSKLFRLRGKWEEFGLGHTSLLESCDFS